MAAMWVFGYGSLIWHPGFAVAESQVARLAGWQRSFCMLSIHYRGSETDPGLVLALDRADAFSAHAFCDGVAFRVEPGAEAASHAALRERELISAAYLEVTLPVTLRDGRDVEALCYVINRDHAQYCRLELDEQARIIAHAVGKRGTNRDYLFATVEHLDQLGIADADLGRLATQVKSLIT